MTSARWLVVGALMLAACTPPVARTTPDEERIAERVASEVFERLRYSGVLDPSCDCDGETAGGETAEAPSADVEADAEPEQVSARHILIQYAGAQRAGQGITRTRDQARARAEGILTRLERGEDFEAVARETSDGPTAARGGDLGSFPRGRMVRAFDDAAFALAVGDRSGVVETPFGFHLVIRYR